MATQNIELHNTENEYALNQTEMTYIIVGTILLALIIILLVVIYSYC
jgi:hypothetical protein